MKIAFLCGSLEQGCDGVGDYTRQLATELIRRGYEVGIIAIKDKHIVKPFTGFQQYGHTNLPVLRLPSLLSDRERFSIAKEWINNFDPVWLSLQYVCFTFQEKGLPFGLSKHFKYLAGKRKLHIMFHELWVGMDNESSLKYKLWGFLQKGIIKSFLRRLKPLLVTTNTHIYQYQLTQLGVKTTVLPLFSNIPVVHNNDSKQVINESEFLTLVIFGNIHFGAPIQEFAKQAAAFSKNNKTVRLIILGRCGFEKQNWINVWEDNNLTYKDFGKQTEEEISGVLSKADFGITTTPYWLTEKSCVVATMHSHKLPVICVARKWHTGRESKLVKPENIFLFDKTNFEKLMENKKIVLSQSDLKSTTNKFLQLLSIFQPSIHSALRLS